MSSFVQPLSTTIALLQPPGLCRAFTRSASSFPPLGLAQLSSVINDTKRCHIIDADGFKWDNTKTLNYLKSFNILPKAIGMTVTTGTTKIIEYWASLIKNELSSHIKIIIGGPHASLDPYSTITNCPSIDYIIKGEAELIFNDVVKMLEDSKDISNLRGVINVQDCSKNLLLNKNNKDKLKECKDYLRTVEILQVFDFDNVPFPILDELPIENYQCPDAILTPMIGFMTQRGCPMRCGFCSTPTLHGKKARGWSVEQILNELEYEYHKYNIREFSFFDDVFTLSPRRTKQICQGIIDKKLKISWFCNARADMLNEDVCKIMKEAGCHLMYLGFESGSNQILKNIQKGCKVDRLLYGASLLKTCGIDRSIGFVIGLPGETDETIQQTIEIAKKVKPERLQFTRWTPLAGSPLVENNINNANDIYNELGFSFHNQELDDKISKWIKLCYQECDYSHQGWAQKSW